MSLLRVRHTIAVLLLAVVAGGGCASSGGGGAEEGAADVDRYEISQEELAIDPAVELLSLIESRRPMWLRSRPMRTMMSGSSDPAVIVDNVIQPGGVDNLRRIRAAQVARVRFMSATDATTRYGPGMAGGAIVVELKR